MLEPLLPQAAGSALSRTPGDSCSSFHLLAASRCWVRLFSLLYDSRTTTDTGAAGAGTATTGTAGLLACLCLGGEGARAAGAGTVATGLCSLLAGAGTGDASSEARGSGVEDRLFEDEDSDFRLCFAAELLVTAFLELLLLLLLLLLVVTAIAGAASDE